MSRKILFVVTSHPQLGPWLEELAAPYKLAVEQGFEVRIASPRGGAAHPDPLSLQSPWLTQSGEWFLGHAEATAKLSNTVPLSDVDQKDYDAAFLVGGTGTMWDFPDCDTLATLVSGLLASSRPLAAICHGVIGLIGARITDGKLLIADRNITCFSDAEERLVQMDTVVPLLAETALRRAGARVVCAAPFEPHVVRDGLLLSGQNPASALPLGRALLDALHTEQNQREEK